MAGGVGGPDTLHLADQSGHGFHRAPARSSKAPSLGLGNHGLGERDGATRADFCLSLLETNGKMVGSNYRRHIIWVGSRTQGDGRTWARSHIKVTLGTTAVPRWSQNSAPITTGQWCLIPDVPALRWSSSYVSPPLQTIREGGAKLAWNLSILRDTPCRPSTPGWLHQPPSSLLHLSFREGRRNIGEKHPAQWKAKGWRRCYISPLINIQSVEEGPEKWPKSQVVPHPTCLTNLFTTITHSTGVTGAPTRRRLSTIFPNIHPPTPTSRPLDWHSLLPLLPTPWL